MRTWTNPFYIKDFGNIIRFLSSYCYANWDKSTIRYCFGCPEYSKRVCLLKPWEKF